MFNHYQLSADMANKGGKQVSLPPLPDIPNTDITNSNILGAVTETTKLAPPETTRISIVSGRTQFDLSVPSQIPIALIMGDLVRLITSRNNIEEEQLNSSETASNTSWTLQRIGEAVFPSDKSLAQLGVKDGDLLLIANQSNSTTTPIYDDVTEAITELNQIDPTYQTTKVVKWLGFSVCMLTGIALIFISLFHTQSNLISYVEGGSLIAISGLIFGAAFLYRKNNRKDLTSYLALFATLIIFTGFANCLANYSLAEKILVGTLASSVLAILSLKFVENLTSVFIGIITFDLAVAGATLPYVWFDYSQKAYGISMSLLALIILANSANLTVLLAKIPLPSVPTMGDFLAETNLPTPIAGTNAVTAKSSPDLKLLIQKAWYANQFLTGIISGAIATVLYSSYLLLSLSDRDWKIILFLCLTGLVFLLRNRIYVDLLQSALLIVSGSILIIIPLVVYANFSNLANLIALGGIFTLGIASLLTLLLYKNYEFSPVQRRFSEIFEYAVIVIIFPLALWIMGIYGYLREL